MKRFILIIYISILTLNYLRAIGQIRDSNNYLILFTDTIKDGYGYKNQKGEIIIELGKYNICYTDTFRTYAIVLKQDQGFVAIDRQQNILYNIFRYDNGPDDFSDGLFRIIKDGKIGYADSSTGKIIIKPQFECAFPFVNGKAKVSLKGTKESDGEHFIWISDNWFYIDKKCKKVIKNKLNCLIKNVI